MLVLIIRLRWEPFSEPSPPNMDAIMQNAAVTHTGATRAGKWEKFQPRWRRNIWHVITALLVLASFGLALGMHLVRGHASQPTVTREPTNLMELCQP